MNKVKDFINSVEGGSRGFADALGESHGTIYVWVHRNSIPRNKWPDIIEIFSTTNAFLRDIHGLPALKLHAQSAIHSGVNTPPEKIIKTDSPSELAGEEEETISGEVCAEMEQSPQF